MFTLESEPKESGVCCDGRAGVHYRARKIVGVRFVVSVGDIKRTHNTLCVSSSVDLRVTSLRVRGYRERSTHATMASLPIRRCSPT